MDAYRYRFKEGLDLRDAEDTLLLAVLAAEGLFGQARVRLEAAYATDKSIHAIVVDAGGEVGRAVNGIFTSLITREFGPDSFDVRRVEGLSRSSGGVSP
jgi:hypothetical protein